MYTSILGVRMDFYNPFTIPPTVPAAAAAEMDYGPRLLAAAAAVAAAAVAVAAADSSTWGGCS